MQCQGAPAVLYDGHGGAVRDGRTFVWIALTHFALFALIARGYVGEAHAPKQRERLPGPVGAGFVLAREKLLARADPWDLGCLGVAPWGMPLVTVYSSLAGANVWWVRAARNYDRPWAISFAVLLELAAVRLHRTLADERRADAVAA